MNQARLYTQAWMWVYNNEWPHSSLGYLTPAQFLLKYGKPHHPHKATAEFPHSNRIATITGNLYF
ncbi:MAG: transposase [Flammeovirgaceae bacterium]|nr:MAG: transposase [Flammeovirgaceae bacterium]